MALPQIPPYELPLALARPPRPQWRLDPDRAALLVHDMQAYFTRPFDADAAPLRPLVANIARLLTAARAAGVPVFYTAQRGNQFRPDRGLQADLWGAGMSALPEHETILPALAPAPGDHVLVKHRYSAFQRSNLERLLRARGRNQLLITGSTPISAASRPRSKRSRSRSNPSPLWTRRPISPWPNMSGQWAGSPRPAGCR
ncbi:isochorismatase family protein [Paracoccus cavernae]|uniref:Isochorismatase family protein n=1 Tax=Paracoccus cavernae TaxID=1571207 RepID=A0ABT8D6U9_9RHOB|nr:isochorismatase family protein [Paracoccus cavernae]